MNALEGQVDGNHYRTQKIQPIQLAYYLRASPCFCKLAKYLSRDKGDKLINLQKAQHCIELEISLRGYYSDGYSRVSSEIAEYWIDMFTEADDIRSALRQMYYGNQQDAKNIVQGMIIRLEQQEEA